MIGRHTSAALARTATAFAGPPSCDRRIFKRGVFQYSYYTGNQKSVTEV